MITWWQDLPPLQSVILQPRDRATVVANADGTVSLRGVAYNGARGGALEAVEVSADGGHSWTAAELFRDEVLPDDARTPHHWLRWSADVPLPRGSGADGERRCVVCCRAFDLHGQSQPRVSPKQRGYLYNGWYKVDLTIAPSGGVPSGG